MLKMFFIGNLTADPRIGEYNGKQVVNLSVAAHTSFKDASGQWITNFIDVTSWTGIDMLARLRKGNKVAVEGSLCVKQYAKKDGTPGINISCKADNVESLTPRPADEPRDIFNS